MAKYPSPCTKCKHETHCTGYRKCQHWLKRYFYRQKQINAFAKQVLPNNKRGKIEVKKQQSPCETCTRVKNPESCCNRNCAAWKKWYLDNQKQINGYAKKHLPDYEERKKKGIHYDED